VPEYGFLGKQRRQFHARLFVQCAQLGAPCERNHRVSVVHPAILAHVGGIQQVALVQSQGGRDRLGDWQPAGQV
jgi:hypothetical protein